MSTGSVVCGDVTSSGTVSAPQLFASNTLIVTNTSDFSDDLFLTKNWAGWSKLQVSNNSAASDSGPELRLLGNQSARVFLERDGGAHQCELIMINDEALVQTKSLSTQLSLTTNQRNPGCLVIAGNTGNVVCNTSFTDLSNSRVKTEIAEADVAELLQLFDSVEAKQYKRPDMNGDLRLLSPHQRALGGAQGLPGPAGRVGSLAGPAGAEEQVNMEVLRDLADDFNVRDPRKLFQLARQRDLDVTQAMAFEALKADVGRQVQAPRPRALGKSAAEGPNDQLQADLIDFSQNTRGKTKYGLVVMDVFTREAAVEPLQNKNAETVGRATKRAAGADGGRRELRGHDRPGQRVRHAGPGAAHRSRAPDEAARGPQRHCRGGPGHPDAEEGPGHARGPQGRPVERPLSADRFGLQRQRQLHQGLPALAAPDGHGVHGPQLLHVAVLRVEAPRRVRRCLESARVLHCLDAAVCQVLVVLELVGVVLEDPELRGRLLLHVFRGAVHRLVGLRGNAAGRLTRRGRPAAVRQLDDFLAPPRPRTLGYFGPNWKLCIKRWKLESTPLGRHHYKNLNPHFRVLDLSTCPSKTSRPQKPQALRHLTRVGHLRCAQDSKGWTAFSLRKHAICSRDLPGLCKWLTLYVTQKPKSYLPIGASHPPCAHFA